MRNFIIKSHKPSTLYMGNYMFILNKGMNSGKPLNEPCPNCFAVIFSTPEERESYYWMAYTLWQAKYWHPFLVGSVIPFLRLDDFKKEFSSRTNRMLDEHAEHEKNVNALRLLEQKEVKFQRDLQLISEMRRIILYRYVN